MNSLQQRYAALLHTYGDPTRRARELFPPNYSMFRVTAHHLAASRSRPHGYPSTLLDIIDLAGAQPKSAARPVLLFPSSTTWRTHLHIKHISDVDTALILVSLSLFKPFSIATNNLGFCRIDLAVGSGAPHVRLDG